MDGQMDVYMYKPKKITTRDAVPWCQSGSMGQGFAHTVPQAQG